MTLRETALRGGVHLAGREVVGLFIRFAGALLITRLIGPSDFGIYAGALAIVTMLATASQLGSEVYLIRREVEPERRVYNEVFTILLVSTGAAVALGLAGSLVVGMVVGSPTVIAAFQVLLLTLPLSVLWAPAQARLERGFRFRSLAYLQVACDAALYGVAVLLAIAGTGVWAPIGGTFASASILLVGSYVLARFRPEIAGSRTRFRELGAFAVRFTPAGLFWNSANLVNPLVVGTVLGSASVGYVALATRLADTASFVLRAVYRVSLVALSRVQTDSERLRRGFEEMVLLAAIGVGVPLAVMSVLAPPLFPMLFGEEWEPALEVLPFVSFFYLMLGVFTTHLALLHVLGRLLTTSFVALLRFVILGVGALLLVSPLGLVGYGIALVVSTIAWVLADAAARSSVGFRYGSAMRWVLALTPALFAPLVDRPWAYVLLAPIVALLLFDRESRRQLRSYGALLRRGSESSVELPLDADTRAR